MKFKQRKPSRLYFDKGNGAIFQIVFEGKEVDCFLEQSNSFLGKKTSPGQNFCDVAERYESLIMEAAELNVRENGINPNVWGNVITTEDLEAAQIIRRKKYETT